MIVAIKSGAVGRVHLDELVNDLDRLGDQRVVGRLDAEANEFEKAGIDYFAFVECSGSVIKLDLFAGIGFSVSRDAKVVVAVTVFSRLSRRPFFDVRLPIVGGREIFVSGCGVAILVCDLSRTDKPGDLGGDG